MEELTEAVTARYREQYLSGILHASLDGFKSLDDWETRPERTKERIVRMLEWSKILIPILIDQDLQYLVDADEGQILTDEQRLLPRREQCLTILEVAKTHPFLDCVRGWAMKQWVERRKWEKILKLPPHRRLSDSG